MRRNLARSRLGLGAQGHGTAAISTADEEVQLRAWAESLRPIAEAYIDAAFSLDPAFKAQGINIDYAKNNLSYLVREYEETETLFRVFVPFIGGGDENVDSAREVALVRPLLEHEGEPDYKMTPEVERLMGMYQEPAAEEVEAQ